MAKAKKTQTELSSKQTWVIGGLVIALVVGAFWVGKLTTELKLLKLQQGGLVAGEQVGGAQQPEVAQATTVTGDQWQQLLDQPAAQQGQVDAQVTIVEFTDYQCPFCKRAWEQSYPEIKTKYIDTGKARYLIRDLPLAFHQNAQAAAAAARCAGDQGAYWQMHDRLFAKQDEWSVEADPSSRFGSYASQLGLNEVSFGACLEEEKYNAAIEADLSLAGKVGATGTPTFFINGRTLVGAQPVAEFTRMIEEELGK